MNTVEALKELYKSFGGKLTDTYDDIADGIPVGNYSVIPDCFAALAEIAGGSIELPVVTQADAGDVLTVGEDGKWTNEEPAKELPTVTSEDAGDVLTVNAAGAWTNAEPTKELPSVTASDNGSVLSVIGGAWAKTSYNLVFKDIILNTDANGKIQSSEFVDYPQGIGLGTTHVILGANILNAQSLLTENVTQVWAETRQAPAGGVTSTIFLIKKIESNQEGVVASTSITLRVFYLVSNTENSNEIIGG